MFKKEKEAMIKTCQSIVDKANTGLEITGLPEKKFHHLRKNKVHALALIQKLRKEIEKGE